MLRIPAFKMSVVPAMVAGSLMLSAVPAHSQDASVTITAPADGETLDIMEQNQIVYDVVPGPDGDHVHVYVDDEEVGILRQLTGSYTFETLAEGNHTLCIKVVNKAHVPIGVEDCVDVTVE